VGTTESRPDDVIVGGGFAEVTTARELTMRGRTSDHDGHAMELGGTWVHPEQPHVGAEISHKGMETETFPVLWAVARTCGGDADDAFLGQRSFA